MKPQLFALFAVCSSLTIGTAFAAGSLETKSTPPAAAAPLSLDLTPYFTEQFGLPDTTNGNFPVIKGQAIIDGLPFPLAGRVRL